MSVLPVPAARVGPTGAVLRPAVGARSNGGGLWDSLRRKEQWPARARRVPPGEECRRRPMWRSRLVDLVVAGVRPAFSAEASSEGGVALTASNSLRRRAASVLGALISASRRVDAKLVNCPCATRRSYVLSRSGARAGAVSKGGWGS